MNKPTSTRLDTFWSTLLVKGEKREGVSLSSSSLYEIDLSGYLNSSYPKHSYREVGIQALPPQTAYFRGIRGAERGKRLEVGINWTEGSMGVVILPSTASYLYDFSVDDSFDVVPPIQAGWVAAYLTNAQFLPALIESAGELSHKVDLQHEALRSSVQVLDRGPLEALEAGKLDDHPLVRSFFRDNAGLVAYYTGIVIQLKFEVPEEMTIEQLVDEEVSLSLKGSEWTELLERGGESACVVLHADGNASSAHIKIDRLSDGSWKVSFSSVLDLINPHDEHSLDGTPRSQYAHAVLLCASSH